MRKWHTSLQEVKHERTLTGNSLEWKILRDVWTYNFHFNKRETCGRCMNEELRRISCWPSSRRSGAPWFWHRVTLELPMIRDFGANAINYSIPQLKCLKGPVDNGQRGKRVEKIQQEACFPACRFGLFDQTFEWCSWVLSREEFSW